MAMTVVTGAAGAIGSACVRLLLRGGGSVVGVDARPFPSDLKEEPSFTGITLSSQDDLAHDSLMKDLLAPQVDAAGGKVAGLICAHGGNPPDVGIDNANYSSPSGTPTEVFVRQYEFNVLSCVAPVSALMPGIIEAGGSVVLASSVNGILGIGETPYSCAKAALHPLAMNIATAYGKHGVNANAVAIGTVASPAIWKSALEADKEILNKIGARNPRAKVGTPEEAAHVMVWLTSKDSALINGSVIVADGGWSIAAGTCRADSSGSWFNT
eukprot:m.88829 g.88829  ORF g.88829 m.88829 type:complete len:269 (+) comp11677_c0_seq4:70-876(+)